MLDKNGREIRVGDTLFNPWDDKKYHQVIEGTDGRLYLGDLGSPLECYAPDKYWEITNYIFRKDNWPHDHLLPHDHPLSWDAAAAGMPVEEESDTKTGVGVKYDVGKPRCGMVLNGFARALIKVCEIGEAGAIKYSPNNWMVVPDGLNRYTDAMHRHWLAEATGELTDKEGLLHAGCLAWNALARLELILRNEENQREQK